MATEDNKLLILGTVILLVAAYLAGINWVNLTGSVSLLNYGLGGAAIILGIVGFIEIFMGAGTRLTKE